MALGNSASLSVGAPQGERGVALKSLFVFRVGGGSMSMRPECNLEQSYVAIFFLPREDWIYGPKAPVDVQGLCLVYRWLWDGRGV
jgi:hypothetical protein